MAPWISYGGTPFPDILRSLGLGFRVAVVETLETRKILKALLNSIEKHKG